MKKEDFNFSVVVESAGKIRKIQEERKRKPSTSIRPLYFEPLPEDSPLKAAIIERINEKNLTYSDLYQYCTNIKGGDINEGQRLGNNIISGLRKRPRMFDTTLSLLCDFINYEILLRPKAEDTDTDDNPFEEEE